MFRLTIAYRGTGFAGWAAQPGMRTVQAELERALARILPEPVALTVAGRTDTGVHAWGQVGTFETSADVPADLARRLNAVLPADVAVREAAPAAAGFDARRSARSRTYCYRVLAAQLRDPFEEDRALWWPRPLDEERLRLCAEAVLGAHDFTAFTPTETEHVRFERQVYRSEWESGSARARGRAGGGSGVLSYWIEADSFMRHMVRVLVGTMLEVAAGRRSLDDFRSLLAGAPRERAGETAPAHGLYLATVRY